MADYVIRSSREIKGCDGCPCQNYNLIMRVPFCNLALETLTEEYAKQKPKWCPLKEVPTHGDLKDWEKIKEIFSKYLPSADDYINAFLCEIMVDIGMNAPTVLEASK